MDNKNPTSFSVNDRLASENANDDRDEASDLNQCINKNGIVPNGSSSRSVRTDSANNIANNNSSANERKQNNNHHHHHNDHNNPRQRRKHASANQRWPYAISSTMNIYSHVLLICVAFVAFGVRNALVLADNSPATTKELGLVDNMGSKYTLEFQLFFHTRIYISLKNRSNIRCKSFLSWIETKF